YREAPYICVYDQHRQEWASRHQDGEEYHQRGTRIGSQGLGRVTLSGVTMGGFAGQLQLRVLDRPVVDQTGLTDRYDFTLNWRPDEFQFPRATAAQRAAAVSRGADALPDLFTAFQ